MKMMHGLSGIEKNDYSYTIERLMPEFRHEPDPLVLTLILEAYEKLGLYETAIHLGEEYLKIDPNFFGIYMWVGSSYCELGKKKEAEKILREGIALANVLLKNDPTSEALLNSIGWMYGLLGDYEQCLEYSKQALEHADAWIQHHDYHSIGFALKGLGKYEEAKVYFQKSLDSNMNHPDAWFDLGECEEKLGNMAEAIIGIERAVELSPQCVKYREKLRQLKNQREPPKEEKIGKKVVLESAEKSILAEVEKKLGRLPTTDDEDTFGKNIVDGHVIKLVMQGCDMKARVDINLLNRISMLPHLKSLGLYQNHLKGLPESIGNLKELEYLSLYDNQILLLPEAIGNLTTLRVFDGRLNWLSELPSSFANLQSLEILVLDLNKFKEFPEVILTLKSLKRLSLSRNEIKSIPDNIGNLTNLEYLDLGDLAITKLPDSLMNLKKLEDFNIKHTTLTKKSMLLLEKMKQQGCNVEF